MATPSPPQADACVSRRLVCQSIALLAAGGTGALHAQGGWPQKPIRLVVPFAPGGSSEVVARSVAGELSKLLGQSVFVENKPGAAGTIAMQDVAKAGADGYTLILGHVGTLAVNPYMLTHQPYDVNKDFTPVTLLAKVPNVLVVHPDVPVKNFKEFIAYAKANPAKLNYSSAGNGSSGHLSMEYLKLTAGFFMTHIPYRGSGPQMTDLLAGRTQVAMNGLPSISAFIRSGKLRALAVGSAQRIGALPDVPTIAESGYKGFETSQWYGLLAPAGTPAPVVKRLQEESLKALRTGPVTERFAHDSAQGVGDTPEQFGAFIAAQQKIWKEIVVKAGIKPD
jgi:tripartite-type tricarboxylate transporter receptor subunit TctC